MHRRPFSLFFCALLFLYFPAEFVWRWYQGAPIQWFDVTLSVLLPLALLVGLIRIAKVWWYTLVALVALWGVEDLYQYYLSRGASVGPLLVHLVIYAISLAYFINPRIRHLYFDPKLRWWRTKRRYETHLPLLMRHQEEWLYPILRNVSLGGCFVETTRLVDVNCPLRICIPLPVPLGISMIKVEGEVRWVSKNPLRQGVGVQFMDPPRPVVRALREYVARQL